MSWSTVRVWPGEQREQALAALFQAGALGVQEVGDTLVTSFPAAAGAEHARDLIAAACPAAGVELGTAPAVDWGEAWKLGIRAHEVGALVIAPPWLASRHDPGRTVVIEPGMAFGTGEHATTRGVLRLMSDCIRFGDRVADLGAGSAILSIAAAKLGAAGVAAIELDPDAIGNAEENVACNGVSDRVHVLQGDAALLLPLVAPVRVVLANILSSALLELLPAISDALPADGEAILSGILAEERTHMLRQLNEQGWAVRAEDHEDSWWSVRIARR